MARGFSCRFSPRFAHTHPCPVTGGGKGPLLRPVYDHLADLRAGETGDVLRQVRALVDSIEETARQELEAVTLG